MIQLSELQDYLDKLLYFDKSLDLSKIDPIMANGLQVKGREEIAKIGFGVSASLELFKIAQEDGGELRVRGSRLKVQGKLEKIFSKKSVWYNYGPDKIKRFELRKLYNERHTFYAN